MTTIKKEFLDYFEKSNLVFSENDVLEAAEEELLEGASAIVKYRKRKAIPGLYSKDRIEEARENVVDELTDIIFQAYRLLHKLGEPFYIVEVEQMAKLATKYKKCEKAQSLLNKDNANTADIHLG